MFQYLKRLLASTTVIVGMLVFLESMTLVGYFAIPPRFFLLYLVTPLYALICLYYSIYAGQTLALIKRQENEQDDLLTAYNEISKRMKRLQVVSYVWSLGAIVNGIASAIEAFMGGNFFIGFVDLLIVAFILWINNRNGKGMRDAVKQLIGEKSKALRDKLVETQEGLSGRPVPQGI